MRFPARSISLSLKAGFRMPGHTKGYQDEGFSVLEIGATWPFGIVSCMSVKSEIWDLGEIIAQARG